MSDAVRPGVVRSAALARKPAFWVILALLAAGGLRIAQITWRFLDAYPIATLTAVVLFALLAVPFWLFVSELDFLEREPAGLRAPGTHLPRIITAGTFYKDGERVFWNVRPSREPVVIELAGERYARLVLSVDDARATAERVERALVRE